MKSLEERLKDRAERANTPFNEIGDFAEVYAKSQAQVTEPAKEPDAKSQAQVKK